MAKLIVIEGLDGSGKATQAQHLVQRFTKNGQPALGISFPDYSNTSSALVRMYLNGEIGGADAVNAYAASSFYAADRYISFVNHWKAPYEAGKVIVADRYTTSNAVHQMAKLPQQEWDSYLDWLTEYEFQRMQLPAPDLVLFLELDVEASQKLLLKRYDGDDTKRDIHERDLAYLARCRTAAAYAGKKLGWTIIPCCENGTIRSIDAIADAVWEKVQEF